MTPTADLRVDDPAWDALDDLEALANAALAAGALEAGHTAGGEVAILLTDDTAMQQLNRDWRGMDKPTDILSFPAGPLDRDFVGDIALGFGIVSRDAQSLQRDLKAHLSHLFVHGLLHLLGFDHETDEDAARMEALEVKALARLGLPDPYMKETQSDGDD